MKNTLKVAVLAGVSTLLPALATHAQNTASADTSRAVSWSSAEIERAAKMLAGSWKTSSAVTQSDGAAQIDIVMTISPVSIDGVDDALYVEAGRADALFEPYRQAIFQFYTYRGGLRLRTYELRNDPGIKNVIVGMAYAPDLIPALDQRDLIATLDLDITLTGDGCKGQTPYPFPTGVGGAVEMVSEIEVSADRLVSVDRGLGADGTIVWGSAEGGRYEFSRIDTPASADRLDQGVVTITLLEGKGEPIAEGQLVTVHYTGYTDDGRSFDSSRNRPQPFTFRWPGELIPGWNIGMAGLSEGERRRVIIPGDQGYGERGNPGAGIGPNSRLVFDIECMKIQSATSQPPQTPAPGGH